MIDQLELPLSVEILTTNNKIVMVDIEDYELVSSFRWWAQKSYYTFYAQRNVKVNFKYTTQYMHTMITGFPYVDHINGDGLDNRKENLRESNNTLNKANARKRTGCTSKYKGVHWYCRTAKWRVQINKDYKNIHLGYFMNEENAARAYDEAAIELFGDHARLNFPKGGK